jgi:hypothetical protein
MIVIKKIIKFIISVWHLPIAYPVLIFYQLYLIKKIGDEGDPQVLMDVEDGDQLQELLQPYCKIFMKKYEVLINSLTIIFWLTIIRQIIIFL